MRYMNTVTILFCAKIIVGSKLFFCASLVFLSCGPRQSLDQTLIPAPTNKPMPTIRQTQSDTSTPTMSTNPASTHVQGANFSSEYFKPGKEVWVQGYLKVRPGYYLVNASSYSIWLILQPSLAEMKCEIPGGNKNNSMYFSNGIPHIKDNQGFIIPWIGHYVTNRSVRVKGIWLGEYSLRIETID